MKIKTVTCPDCGAEQAILRNEDGTMNCAFCGKEIENLPEPDENEGLYYTDKPEEEAEQRIAPEGEPVKAVFILSADEVESALLTAGKLKKRKLIPIIEAVAFALLGIASLFTVIFGILGIGKFTRPGVSEWIFTVLMFVMIPVVFVLPNKAKKNIVKNSTSGNELTVTVYENVADVVVEKSGEKGWQLPLDGSYTYRYENALTVLSLKNGQILVIPDRAVNENEVETLHARLLPKEEEKAGDAEKPEV